MDGTADACWSEGTTLYGFSAPEFAGYFLAEDEYRRLNPADSAEFGSDLAAVAPPTWKDTTAQLFEYLGTY